MANLLRLMLHTLAYHLLVWLRRLVACPPDPGPASPPGATPLPLEARPPREKRAYHNVWREADPLGKGHVTTWRTRLIKVAAQIETRTRVIRVCLSSAWPFWGRREEVTRAVQEFCGGSLGSGLAPESG